MALTPDALALLNGTGNSDVPDSAAIPEGGARKVSDLQTAGDLSPTEQIENDTYEHSAPVQADFKQAVDRETDPKKKAILQADYDKNFGGSSAPVTSAGAPPLRDRLALSLERARGIRAQLTGDGAPPYAAEAATYRAQQPINDDGYQAMAAANSARMVEETKAQQNRERGIVGDTLKATGMGALGIGEMGLNLAYALSGSQAIQSVANKLGDWSEQLKSSTSPAMQDAMQKKWVDEDGSLGSAFADPRAYLFQLGNLAGGALPMLFGGEVIGIGAEALAGLRPLVPAIDAATAAGKAATSAALKNGVEETAAAQTGKQAAQDAFATKATELGIAGTDLDTAMKQIFVARYSGQVAAGTYLHGADAANAAMSAIAQMPQDKKMESPKYADDFNEYRKTMSPQDAEAKATGDMLREGGLVAAQYTATRALPFQLIMGYVNTNLLHGGMGAKTRLGNVALATAEGVPSTAAELALVARGGNEGQIATVNPKLDPMSDVANTAVGTAAGSLFMGLPQALHTPAPRAPTNIPGSPLTSAANAGQNQTAGVATSATSVANPATPLGATPFNDPNLDQMHATIGAWMADPANIAVLGHQDPTLPEQVQNAWSYINNPNVQRGLRVRALQEAYSMLTRPNGPIGASQFNAPGNSPGTAVTVPSSGTIAPNSGTPHQAAAPTGATVEGEYSNLTDTLPAPPTAPQLQAPTGGPRSGTPALPAPEPGNGFVAGPDGVRASYQDEIGGPWGAASPQDIATAEAQRKAALGLTPDVEAATAQYQNSAAAGRHEAIRQLVGQGFTGINRAADGSYSLDHPGTGQTFPLQNPADVQVARATLKRQVDAAAHTGAASPLNDLPQPTAAQITAGNAKLAPLTIHGLKIKIENPEGSIREDKQHTPPQWRTHMQAHYGYIEGTKAADGEGLDAFIGPRPDSKKVYVIDQTDKTGQYDEHKVMLGYTTEHDARQGYLANYEKGWTGLGAITEMPMDQFKDWLKHGDTTQAVAYGKTAEEIHHENEPSPDHGEAAVNAAPVEEGSAERAQAGAAGEVGLRDQAAAPRPVDQPDPASGNGVRPADQRLDRSWIRAQIVALIPLKAKVEREGKGHQIDKLIDLAKRYMAGDDVKPGKFKSFVGEFTKIPPVEVIAQSIYDTAKEAAQTAASEAKRRAKEATVSPQAASDTQAASSIADETQASVSVVRPMPDERDPLFQQKNTLRQLQNALDGLTSPNGATWDKEPTLRAGYERSVTELEAEIAQAGETQAPPAEPRFGSGAVESLSAAENELRALSFDKVTAGGPRGDVRLGNGKYVSFDDALRYVREAVAAGVKPVPFQIHAKLDINIGETDRLLAALNPTPKPVTPQIVPVAALTDAMNTLGEMRARLESQGRVVDDRLLSRIRQQEQIVKDLQAPPQVADPFANNKLFTADKVAEARARMRSKLGRLNTGLDPELFQDGVTIAGAYIESGIRSFADFARAMVADFGNGILPYLRSFYEGVRYYPNLDTKGMTAAAEIDKADINDYAATSEDTTNEHSGNGAAGEAALEGALPGRLQPAGEGQSAGVRSLGSSEPDTLGNGYADAGRDDRDAGVGVGAKSLHPARPDVGVQPGLASEPADLAESTRDDPPASEPKAPRLAGDNPGNYVITAQDDLGEGTRGNRIDDNLNAIRIVKQLEAEQRHATAAEQQALVKYVGWGGLKNVFDRESKKPQDQKARAELERLLNEPELFWAGQSVLWAHYTSKDVINSMYSFLAHLGFTGGNALEPTVGVGHFIGLMPEGMRNSSKWYAAEIDPITSLIAKHLYPESRVLTGTGFQKAEFPYGKFDLAIGNPPFGDERIADINPKRAAINRFKIHNYIIAKSGLHLKPGGVMAMVVTNRFLDTKDPEAREMLAKNFRLLGAVRLPNDAFAKTAGTEVTTDLVFLQKLLPGEKAESNPDWLETGATLTNAQGEAVTLNRYFANRPHLMLGEPSMQGTMYGSGEQFTLNARPGQDTHALFRDLLRGEFAPLHDQLARQRNRVDDATPANIEANREDVAVGGYIMEGSNVFMRIDDDANGNVQFAHLTPRSAWSDSLVPDGEGGYSRTTLKDGKKSTATYRSDADVPDNLRLGESRLARIQSLLRLREKAYDLIRAERADATNIEALRSQLNDQYDAFVAQHGFINDPANAALMADDVRIESGLEMNYRKEMTAARAKMLKTKAMPAHADKAALLTQRVFYPYREIIHADTPTDGYAVSLSEKGKLDLNYIAELTGKRLDDVITELSSGDKPYIFRDPVSGEWLQEDHYLSGNVKAKLAAIAGKQGFEKNAEALRAVQPADIPYRDIFVDMGATWVPADKYEDFLRMLGVDDPEVNISEATGTVNITGYRATELNQFSTELKNDDFNLIDLFNKIANKQPVIAYDHVPDGDGGTTRVVNKDRTKALVPISKKLNQLFKDWIFADEARALELEKRYNDTQNTTIERQYDGKHLRTVGNNPAFMLRDTQRNAAWRIIQSPVVLLDHVVGAGKTATFITGLMERRRLGLSRKPMVVVPNHIVGQWAKDWLSLYPGANILAATEKDFSKPNRRRLFSRIATGNYDAIIVGHSSFGFIPVDAVTEEAFVMAEVEHLQNALADAEQAKDKRTVRALKNRIAKRMERIAELKNKPRDNVATFEDMGIDHLSVDESQEFKNLEYSTAMGSMAGMGTPEGSKRAFDLYMKLQTLFARGGAAAFGTGTPISNSLVEMYSLMRYLNRDGLKERGIEAFDAWAKNYAGIESRIEYTATQKLKERTIMASFNNIPEMLQLYNQFADSVTMADLKAAYAEQIRRMNEKDGTRLSERFPVPTVLDGGRQLDTADPSDEQREYMDYLIARADALEKAGKDFDPRVDNMLWIMSDARKMALDMRLVDPLAQDYENNKINRAARQIKAYYDQWHADRGTQLVFCDLSTPTKSAAKEARQFIKAAVEKLGLAKDKSVESLMERMTWQERWSYLRNRMEDAVGRPATSDDKRDALEKFLDTASDAEGALITADVGFSVYDDLKKKLVALGIPEGEVRFIHEANTQEQKKELFAQVNTGSVRVMMGSSPKMGAGTNVQKRLVAEHHMDSPWRPSDVEQREGRIIRQGNELYDRDPEGFRVGIHAYSTNQTFDSVMWQILARKAAMIEGFRSGKRSVDDGESDSSSYANFMAETTGNPIFKEKIRLENDIEELEATERRIKTQRWSAERTLQTGEEAKAKLGRKIEDATEEVATAQPEGMTVSGKFVPDDAEAVTEEEQAKYQQEYAQFTEDFARYNDEMTAYEATPEAEREAKPKRPKEPQRPYIASARVVERSAQARAIVGVAERLHQMGESDTLAVKVGDLTLTFDKTKEGKSAEYAVASPSKSFYRDSHKYMEAPVNFVADILLHARHGLAMAKDGALAALDRQNASIERAHTILQNMAFKEADALAQKKARYEAVIAEVNSLEAEMNQSRAQRVNKYLNNDSRRFPDGDVREVPAPVLDINAFHYRRVGDSIEVAPDAKPVELPELAGESFYAYKKGSEWFVVEATTGASLGRGDTRKGALEAANAAVTRNGVATVKDRIATLPKIDAAQKAAAVSSYQAQNGPAAFSRKASSGTLSPVDENEARNVIDRFNRGLAGLAGVELLPSGVEFPDAVKLAAQKAGIALDSFKGVLIGHTMYLVQDAHSSIEEMESTVFHELYGHYGIRSLFGEAVFRKLAALYGLIGSERVLELARKYGVDMDAYRTMFLKQANGVSDAFKARAGSELDLRRSLVMDELLAHIAGSETGKISQYAKELIGAIRQWLRSHGFAELTQYGDTDLAYLLKQARESIKTGEFAGGSIASFSMGAHVAGTLDTAKAHATTAADKLKATDAIQGAGEAWDGLMRAIRPEDRTAEAKEVARLITEGLGEKEMASVRFRADLGKAVKQNRDNLTLAEKARDLLEKGLTLAADKLFVGKPAEDNYAFINAMEHDDQEYFKTRPEMKSVADLIRKMFDAKVKEVQALGTGALQHVLENYFPHIWNRLPDADKQRAIFSMLSKGPRLEGGKNFTNHRVFEDFMAGINAGFEPISNNPLDLVMLKMEEMDKYILAHKTLQALEGSEGVDLIPAGDKTPSGYTDINGRYGSIERDGQKWRYVGRDDVAQVLNNYLSQSLYHNKYVGKPFTAYMKAANVLNQFQLGAFSAFHAGFTSFEAVISHAAIGLKALSTGDFKGAAHYLKQAPMAWLNNPKMGDKIIQEIMQHGTHPEMAQIIEGLQLAGFKYQLDNRFRTDATKKMMESWAAGNKATAGFHAISAIVEQSARPIMEWLVPRQKFGVFGEMYSKWMLDNPNASHAAMRNAAQQIWNRVDSRLGQVVYERLFLHNVTKNFTQMLIRAPGWTGGTILEVGGGLKDLAQYAKDLATGKPTNGLSDRAAYTLSMLMVTALSNALLTAMFTGNGPDDWKDLVAFRTGDLDEHGRAERFMLPTYMKDVYAYAHQPLTTLKGKSHPLLSLIGDTIQNRDHFGNEIRSEDDNLLTQLTETAGYAAKAFVPFWIKGEQKEASRGGNLATMALPLAGVMPATSNLNQSAAERLMTQYNADRAPQGSRTQAEAQRADLKGQMTSALRKGDREAAMELFRQGRADGILTNKDFAEVSRTSNQAPLVHSFGHLTYDQARRVMDVASDEEKQQLSTPFRHKQNLEARKGLPVAAQ